MALGINYIEGRVDGVEHLLCSLKNGRLLLFHMFLRLQFIEANEQDIMCRNDQIYVA